MHADYFESKLYVYTAILYDEQPEDLIGGETALVDFVPVQTDHGSTAFGLQSDTGVKKNTAKQTLENAATQPLKLTSGMVVEPKPGRLVLFSSGGENFHAPLEVVRGKRPTFHFWFKCIKSEDRE